MRIEYKKQILQLTIYLKTIYNKNSSAYALLFFI